MSALGDYGRIWRVAVGRRREDGVWTMGNLLVLAAVMGGVWVFATAHRPFGPLFVPRVLLGAAAFWLALAWLLQFMPASVAMNSAANARLLPRQRRRLMQMAALGWLLGAGGIGLATFDWTIGFMFAVLLLMFALSLDGSRTPIYLVAIAGNAVWILPMLLGDAVAGAFSTPAGRAAQAAALAAASWYVLHRLYPDGGDAHMAQRVRQADFLAVIGKGRKAQLEDLAMRTGWSARALYLASLRRACRAADPGRLLVHVLGPAVHWSAQIVGIAIYVGLAAGTRVALSYVDEEGVQALLTGVPRLAAMTLPLTLAFSTGMYGMLLRRRAGEQALLRLAPRTGDAALLNRRLGARLLRTALQNGLLMAAAIVAATALVGMRGDTLLMQIALCALGLQIALIGVPGDYAKAGGWTPARVGQAVVTAAAEGALAWALGAWSGAAWAWLIALACGVGALQVWRGWRAMLAAPVAFPAGRM